MKVLSLVLKYAFFALIAIAFNLGTQFVVSFFYKGLWNFYLALFAGTFVGLVVKYILDKKYIFYHQVKTKQEDIKKFIFYSLMGVFTTFIFWGIEFIFYTIFPHFEYAKYIGGFIGLCIGYFIKYHLDKKFVFVHS